VIYRMLGELEIGQEGQLLRLPGGPSLILIAALLIGVNRKMSKTDLIRAMWGSEDMAEAQLHKRAASVRDMLDRIGRREDLITHHGFGYEMRVPENEIDTLQFRRLVREAYEAELRGNADDEVERLRKALRLWRGAHPLSNVPTDAFHRELAQLEQRLRRAAVRLFDLELARSHHELIMDELIQIAGSYPEDERLCEQLMIAAYRSGHPADVARAYERHAEWLETETARAPDSLLREFHFAVACGDDEAIRRAEAAISRRRSVSPPAAAPVPRQLPRAPELVGRTDQISELTGLLGSGKDALPVIVISGAGGIGKTGLARRAAHNSADQYPDGQLYAELRGTAGPPADTFEVLAQFLRALGVTRVPDAKAERLTAYRTLLADRRILVVLDDAASASQVAELVPGSASCSVLVTARQRLPELDDAYHVAPLEALGTEDATELFLRVVRDANIKLPNLDHVDEVVALCGGLPLALRIAGALRVHDHPQPTAALARRLASQGPEAFAYDQLSVARTIGTGFERLDVMARSLFLGLGLLPLSGFGLWTAAALLDGTQADPAVVLSQLAARFMITSADSRTRYGFHDLTRAYARRRAEAEQPGAVRAVPQRAYSALLTLTRRAHARLYGAEFDVVHSGLPDWDAPSEVLAEVDADPLQWFEIERENIRAAVEHSAAIGLAEVCWDLAVSAHEFYTIRGYYDDWQATHSAALAACRVARDRRGEAMVLTCRNQPALIASQRVDEATSLAELELAVRLLSERGDGRPVQRDSTGGHGKTYGHARAVALRTLANALRRQGFLHRPLGLFEEALAGFAASGDSAGWWQAKRFIGQTYTDLGRPDDARQALAEAEAAADAAGWTRLLAQTRYWLGQACLAQPADLDAAQVAFDAVYDIFGEDDGVGRAYALHGLGDIARHRGGFEVAEEHLTLAAALARRGADAALEGRVMLSLAELRADQGRPQAQVEALEQAADVFAPSGFAYLEIRAATRLAGVLAAQGQTAAADGAWERVAILEAALPVEDRRHR
jgi:DNA-binding SARP family transcriptional activator/tetratricopeptide (TPR) repeat protein